MRRAQGTLLTLIGAGAIAVGCNAIFGLDAGTLFPPACTTNADCTNGACVKDTARPITASLFCIPPTASPSINAAGGIPGPGAIQFNSGIVVCRCGDGEIGCGEECDDGNGDAGDGCDDACRLEP